MTDEMITITLKEYNHLKELVSWLVCLEEAGVDNWEGMEEAIHIRRERFGFGEDEDDE